MSQASGFRCPECCETFTNDDSLRFHLETEFRADRGHLHCYVCRQYFRTVDGLNHHIEEVCRYWKALHLMISRSVAHLNSSITQPSKTYSVLAVLKTSPGPAL
jgi:hypothetical protein